ncbi:MAG: hypothetical protein J7518_04725 [Nocardioidaceae bacterium]|nr:hypothetical protein [Nocardioidaceae bacterium]
MTPMDIGDSLQKAADTFFNFLPNLLGFLVLLVVGYVVARIVARILARVLESAGLDRRLAETDTGRFVENSMPRASAARGIGAVVFWLVFGFFLVAAVSALQIDSVTVFLNQVLAYLPNIVVAILIFVAAALLSGAATKAISRTMGDAPMGKILATVVPTLIMVIAMFMILQQLRIAAPIVQIAFAATIGAVALGLALAFGLGGRSVAQEILEDAYRRNRDERMRRRAGQTVPPPRAEAPGTEAPGTEATATATYTGAPRSATERGDGPLS